MVSSHSVMLSRTVPSNSTMPWSTTASELRSKGRGTSAIGTPSKQIVPPQGSNNPVTSLPTVDLPLPEAPTSATRAPATRSRSNFSISGPSSGL